jgi:hypothetical protein
VACVLLFNAEEFPALNSPTANPFLMVKRHDFTVNRKIYQSTKPDYQLAAHIYGSTIAQ